MSKVPGEVGTEAPQSASGSQEAFRGRLEPGLASVHLEECEVSWREGLVLQAR